MRSTLPEGKARCVERDMNSMLNVTRHPKIIEDKKAIEVVLRLEETVRPTAGVDDNGRRFTVTAIGSRLSSDHRRLTIASAIIAAGNDITTPPVAKQRKSSDIRKSSRASSNNTTDGDVEDLIVPTHVLANSQYLPHLEAIEETLPGLRTSSLHSSRSGYFS
jgi:hypothetical protein